MENATKRQLEMRLTQSNHISLFSKVNAGAVGFALVLMAALLAGGMNQLSAQSPTPTPQATNQQGQQNQGQQNQGQQNQQSSGAEAGGPGGDIGPIAVPKKKEEEPK